MSCCFDPEVCQKPLAMGLTSFLHPLCGVLSSSDLNKFILDAADGDEGGRHNLITAVINNGQLFLCKIQAGDKRYAVHVPHMYAASNTTFTSLDTIFRLLRII